MRAFYATVVRVGLQTRPMDFSFLKMGYLHCYRAGRSGIFLMEQIFVKITDIYTEDCLKMYSIISYY